jgi:DNA-binding beta-propeller fold protein YncE
MNNIGNRWHGLNAIPSFILGLLWLCGHVSTGLAADAASPSDQAKAWRAAVIETQAQVASLDPNSEVFAAAAEQFSVRGERQFPVPWDWCLQDAGPDFGPWLSPSTVAVAAQKATANVLAELGTTGRDLQGEFDRLVSHSSTGQELVGRASPPAESSTGILPATPESMGGTHMLRSRAGTHDLREQGQDGRATGQWLDLYLRAAELRREVRLRNLRQQYPRWIFTKHCILGGSHYAYTEGQSDAQNERQFEPGAALCRLELEGAECRVRALIEDSDGVIRDPDVSWDGRRVLFAWKKSDRKDDYHLYEMTVATKSVKQLTQGLGFADYEGVYLPNGDILFNSTRCVQTVDCWWTEVSNLYTCSGEGRHLRRLTFDQVHDNFPTVMPDGRIVYTRWEYQDRGQLFVQGLFQMNPNGTGQTEFYANDSWFPTSLLHARGIPGTQKVVAIFSGHHTRQVGKLGIVDPARGRQENAGTQLIAPVRQTPAERIDFYGQDGELFQYPYPLSESEFVVACAPLGWSRRPTLFKLYWIAADGRRELLAADPDISCGQAVPLAVRPRPPVRPSLIDYGKTAGTCYLQDVYAGPGLAGIARGTIKKLRVIGLEYRAAGVGWNYNVGPAGDALACTPVAVGNGSWDVKVVLGDATVHPDGSAFFTVPARMPVYFQAIDARGYAVQTMRSWATLQPGENASCAGCHEAKNSTPAAGPGASMAMKAGPQALIPFYDPPRGFSFAHEIQPILDRHCIRCHNDTGKWEERLARAAALFTLGPQAVSRVEGVPPLCVAGILPAIRGRDALDTKEQGQDALATGIADRESALSLLGTPVVEDLAKRRWSASYLALVRTTEQTLEGHRYLAGTTNDAMVNWVGAQSEPNMLAPYAAGAARSRLLSMLADGHYGVQLTTGDIEKLACWIDLQVPFCGSYEEANQWTGEQQQTYRHFLEKRRRMEELERRNIAEWSKAQTASLRTSARVESKKAGKEESKNARSTSVSKASRLRIAGGTPATRGSDAQDAFLSPIALAASGTGNELYVIAATGQQLLVIDRTTCAVSRRIPLPEAPSGITISPDGKNLYVTAGLPQGLVLVIDPQTGAVRARIPAGYSPTAPVLSEDGNTLFVCDRYRSRLLAVDVAAQKIKAELPVGREPVAAARTPDGRFVLVANLLPAGPATGPTVAAEVVAVSTADLTVAARIALLNGSTSVRGICVSPDGRHAYVVHTLAHYQLPTTQVDRGWMNTSALSIVETATWRRINTILLDDVDHGAANPWDVACTADGQWLCVSHAGTHEVSIIDRPGLHRVVAKDVSPLHDASGSQDASSDLSFLVDLRRRIRLPGKGPRGIAIAGQTLYAAEYFSDSAAAVDLSAASSVEGIVSRASSPRIEGGTPSTRREAFDVRSIPLGPTPEPTVVRRGEMLFHDADLCFQQWQSCASCHPDARADGLNWDLLNDGLGTPKNTRSLLWAHRTPPAMSLGVRETAEAAVRAGIRHIQFVVRPEADAAAIDAYLKSLQPLPSPYAAEAGAKDVSPLLDARIQGGKRVFEKAGCQKCHTPPLYTSRKAYDVGTGAGREAGQAFDTPTLVELWRTAPYLHDGRAATLEELLTTFNPGDRHGKTSSLSTAELDDLVAFLLSL